MTLEDEIRLDDKNEREADRAREAHWERVKDTPYLDKLSLIIYNDDAADEFKTALLAHIENNCTITQIIGSELISRQTVDQYINEICYDKELIK